MLSWGTLHTPSYLHIFKYKWVRGLWYKYVALLCPLSTSQTILALKWIAWEMFSFVYQLWIAKNITSSFRTKLNTTWSMTWWNVLWNSLLSSKGVERDNLLNPFPPYKLNEIFMVKYMWPCYGHFQLHKQFWPVDQITQMSIVKIVVSYLESKLNLTTMNL